MPYLELYRHLIIRIQTNQNHASLVNGGKCDVIQSHCMEIEHHLVFELVLIFVYCSSRLLGYHPVVTNRDYIPHDEILIILHFKLG